MQLQTIEKFIKTHLETYETINYIYECLVLKQNVGIGLLDVVFLALYGPTLFMYTKL